MLFLLWMFFDLLFNFFISFIIIKYEGSHNNTYSTNYQRKWSHTNLSFKTTNLKLRYIIYWLISCKCIFLCTLIIYRHKSTISYNYKTYPMKCRCTYVMNVITGMLRNLIWYFSRFNLKMIPTNNQFQCNIVYNKYIITFSNLNSQGITNTG